MKQSIIKLLSIILLITFSTSSLAAECISGETQSCLCFFDSGKENGMGKQTCNINNEYDRCVCKKNYQEFNWGISTVVIGTLSFVIGSSMAGIAYENNRSFPQNNDRFSICISFLPIVAGIISIAIGSYLAFDGGKKTINTYLPHYTLTNNSFSWTF